jgi:hypothetical protein
MRRFFLSMLLFPMVDYAQGPEQGLKIAWLLLTWSGGQPLANQNGLA